MRPHTMSVPVSAEADSSAIDHDLGWNDMGHDGPHESQVVPINRDADARRQQERLVREFASASVERRSAFQQGRKAAFTLRLDEERHLRLRLACTAQNLSAQAVVTQALDKFLADNPEIAAIAGELCRKRN